jgi:hypothetical protein
MTSISERQDIPQPFIFEGQCVYLLNDLIAFDRSFFVGCIREPRKTIEKKNIPEDQYWFATYFKGGWFPESPENRKAKILISDEWTHNNLPKFTGNQDNYKYKPLPPLLELEEHEKFNRRGKVFKMEVRGDKTREGIRFKCEDVARIFEMDLIHNIDRWLVRTEYEIFCSYNPFKLKGSEQNVGGQPTSTYLTFDGLLKIIFASRSGTAYRFQDWVSDIIYAAHLGTSQERVNAAAYIV